MNVCSCGNLIDNDNDGVCRDHVDPQTGYRGIYNGNTAANGWTCSICRAWVEDGMYHDCTMTPGFVQPTLSPLPITSPPNYFTSNPDAKQDIIINMLGELTVLMRKILKILGKS